MSAMQLAQLNTQTTTQLVALKDAGGITAPHGFKAVGAHVGLKKKKKDLAIIASDVPANVAAVFTTNIVKAAPIIWNQQVVASGKMVSAIVINSGNANACTGPSGIEHTEMMAQTVADCLGSLADRVLVASTGIIGVPLPIDTVCNGIKSIAGQLDQSFASGTQAAEAILTTDSFSKEIATRVAIGGVPVSIGAMAKGSGMIHPNMATMLGFITTDVNISPTLLQEALKESVQQTYNMISVDGDTSTNDMVAILANGLSGNPLIKEKGKDYFSFLAALNEANLYLAKAIASDGEGATKFLEVTVEGTNTKEDAQLLAKSVISSSLVKTAFFGEDANWGRIMAALGYGGVIFDPNKVSITIVSKNGAIALLSDGAPVVFDEIKAKHVLKEKNIQIQISVGDGLSQATAWGCDLTYDYVRINGSYRT